MGLLDSLEGMASQAMAGSDNNNVKVAGGLMAALQENPGGLGAVLENLRNNGMGAHADAIQNGETPETTTDQVDAGMAGTGLLESAAEKAGVSPEVARQAMTTVLPMVLAHFSQNGGDSSLLGGLLAKFL